jgi:hypothetical protein
MFIYGYNMINCWNDLTCMIIFLQMSYGNIYKIIIHKKIEHITRSMYVYMYEYKNYIKNKPSIYMWRHQYVV